MPIVLSTAEQSIKEPKRQNRFILKFDSVPGGDPEALALDLLSASRPSISFNSTVINRLNEQFKFAANPTWDQIACVFYDYDKGKDSSAQILWNWARSVYDPVTGAMGFAVQYKTNATLVILSPDGSIAETWDLFGCYPDNVTYNEVTYGGYEALQANMTLNFDYAILQEDTTQGNIPSA